MMYFSLLFLSIVASTTILGVDGRWGPWKIVQRCTKPCGGGKMARVRLCQNRNGEGCVGQAEEIRACNTHRCPIGRGTHVACEHGGRNTIHLSCPHNMRIDITWALYGRMGRAHCDDWFKQAFWNKHCRSGSSLSAARSRCNGHVRCNLQASNSIFGDPCPHTEKYLKLSYRCV